MADISIPKTHSVDMAVLRGRLEELATDLKNKYGVRYTGSGNTCNLSGAGLKKGVLDVTESNVRIEVTLGMMAKLLKPKIEEQINKKIDRAISE